MSSREQHGLFYFLHLFLFCIMGKKNEGSSTRGWHSEQIVLKLVSYWWMLSIIRVATQNQQWAVVLPWFKLITTWSLRAEHDSLFEQFETKTFCVLCLLTQCLHLTQVGNRWRPLRATCLGTHFKVDASPPSNNIHVIPLPFPSPVCHHRIGTST